MSKRVVAYFLIFVFVLGAIFVFVPREDASADNPVNCTVQVLNIVCVEAGVQVLNQPITIPTVKVTLPGPTVTLPAPPRATRTIEVPGPRTVETVTAPAAPVATQTIREPGSVVTKTVGPTAAPTRLPNPTATVTVPGLAAATTITPSPRQPQASSGTLDQSGDGILPRQTTPVIVTGIGLGILALIAALIVLGMYGGYYIGYKDSDKADANFFRALLNKEE